MDDQRRPYSLSVLAPDPEARNDSRVHVQQELRDFILDFRLDNSYIYRLTIFQYRLCTTSNEYHRDQIRQNVLVKQYYCDVDIAHLVSYNEELAHRLTTEPAENIPLVSCARS